MSDLRLAVVEAMAQALSKRLSGPLTEVYLPAGRSIVLRAGAEAALDAALDVLGERRMELANLFMASLKARSKLADETGSSWWVEPDWIVDDLVGALRAGKGSE